MKKLMFAMFTASLAAQVSPDRAIVVTALTGPQQTAILEVNPVTGTVVRFGRFSSDNLPPLAVAVDPINRDLVLALATPNGTRLVRLGATGTTITRERWLGDLAWPITQLAVDTAGDLVLSVSGSQGGLYTMPRNGGPGLLRLAAPFLTAFAEPAGLVRYGVVAQSGTASPPRDPALGMVSIPDYTYLLGPTALPGYTPLTITGIASLPTALIRFALVHDDGSVAMYVHSMGNPTPLPVQPRLPAGATIAMKGTDTLTPLVLGNSSHPYLKSFEPFSANPTWRLLAGPFPGDPVDFALSPAVSPRVDTFGQACSRLLPHQLTLSGGLPTLGNFSFVVGLDSQYPFVPALVVLGLNDQSLGSTPLPLPLPGGCLLHSTVDLAFVTTTNARGSAGQAMPIPADPSLSGAIVFGQWFAVDRGSLAATAGFAIELR